MNGRRFSLFQRRVGRDVRAWPILALLLLVVLVGIGCVLWFMGEAMRNERMAVREQLAEAYRASLTLVQTHALERWNQQLSRLDGTEPDTVRFARCVCEGLAESIICLDEQGTVTYPRQRRVAEEATNNVAEAVEADLRTLVSAGRTDDVVKLVIEKFARHDSPVDAQSQSAAANAELLALELLPDKAEPRFTQIAWRLRDRATDYTSDVLPSAQRRFIMHELGRLDPAMGFPTMTAEDLAARFLDANPVVSPAKGLHATELRDVWAAASPSRRVLALFVTEGLRSRLGELTHDPPLPKGVSITVVAPGEDAMTVSTLVIVPLGAQIPGWKLALSLDDNAVFTTESAKRVKLHVMVACLVIAVMSALTLFIARSFGRQVQLARLKNDLVANVSHELKTPLTAMRALVDTLLDTEKFDEKTTREYLELLATENARLSRLIENFLTFSRLERNKFKFEFTRVRPEQVVEEAIAAFGERAHAPGCVFESHVSASLPAIRADADALVTAVLNLLDNAWKYSGDEKRIVLHAEADDRKVRFSVKDSGIGLSPGECKRIFRRFYQSDQRLARTAGGCGLGLSIVQSIVEAHHGSVHVKSEPGHGSTFTIEIPVVKEGTI